MVKLEYLGQACLKIQLPAQHLLFSICFYTCIIFNTDKVKFLK